MKHLKYLAYIVRHKWFVLLACWERGLFWQGIVHDWSKFLPSEWLPYANFFYGYKPSQAEREQAKRVLGYDPYPSDEEVRAKFNIAWIKHQHRSPHHWQHWVLRNDDGTQVALEMPKKYALEMLADWDGAGRAITGVSGGTRAWYSKNRYKMTMHPNTRLLIDSVLGCSETVHVSQIAPTTEQLRKILDAVDKSKANEPHVVQVNDRWFLVPKNPLGEWVEYNPFNKESRG